MHEIITKKSLLAAPKRLQRMLLALQHYNLEVQYHPGVMQHIADALSRAPVDRPKAEQLGKEEVFRMSLADTTEEEIEHCTSLQQVHVSDERMGAVKREAAHDDEQQRFVKRSVGDGQQRLQRCLSRSGVTGTSETH